MRNIAGTSNTDDVRTLDDVARFLGYSVDDESLRTGESAESVARRRRSWLRMPHAQRDRHLATWDRRLNTVSLTAYGRLMRITLTAVQNGIRHGNIQAIRPFNWKQPRIEIGWLLSRGHGLARIDRAQAGWHGGS